MIAIEDVLVPEVFEFEDEVAIGSPEDGAGFWAAVPGLDRPERALLQSLTTGSTAVAALFRASPGSRLIVSFETARAIGVSDLETAPVRIRAIRSEVRLGAPPTGF